MLRNTRQTARAVLPALILPVTAAADRAKVWFSSKWSEISARHFLLLCFPLAHFMHHIHERNGAFHGCLLNDAVAKIEDMAGTICRLL